MTVVKLRSPQQMNLPQSGLRRTAVSMNVFSTKIFIVTIYISMPLVTLITMLHHLRRYRAICHCNVALLHCPNHVVL